MDEKRLKEIEKYTTSGNAVPVTRVTLPAEDVRDLIAEVRRLRTCGECPEEAGEPRCAMHWTDYDS